MLCHLPSRAAGALVSGRDSGGEAFVPGETGRAYATEAKATMTPAEIEKHRTFTKKPTNNWRGAFKILSGAPEIKWCQRRDLNPRPKAYESSALPLSYSGRPIAGRDTVP